MESKKRINELNLEENQQKNQIKWLEEIMKDWKFSSEELVDILAKFKLDNDLIYQKYIEENSKILIDSENERKEFLNLVLDNLKLGITLWIISNNNILKQKFLEELANKNSYIIIDYFDYFKNEKYAKELMETLLNDSTFLLFDNYEKIKNDKYADELIKKAIEIDLFWFSEFVDKNPDFPKHYIDYFDKIRNNKEKIKKSALLNPFWFFSYTEKFWKTKNYDEIKKLILKEQIDFENEDWTKNKLNLIVAKSIENPYWARLCFSEYKNESIAKDVLLIIAKQETAYVFQIINEIKILPYAEEVLLSAIKINWLYTFEYFSDIKKLPYIRTILEASSESLIKMNLQEYELIRIARVINDLHEETEENRFSIISKFDANYLYKLISIWRSEIFTSTYNWILNRLLKKIEESWIDIYDLASRNNFIWINIFIEARASYNKLDLVFDTIKNTEKKKLLINQILDEDRIKWNLPDYVAILEIIKNNKNQDLQKYIYERLEKNIENWQNKESYLIIAKEINKIDEKYFSEIPEKYSLSNLKEIKSSELFDEKWQNIQQYFFYNDEDWKSSFKSFIWIYKNSTDWKIEDKGTFVIIKSKENNKKQIKIFANKPDIESGSNDIKSFFTREFIIPQVVVHRWHSYHVADSIKEIQEDVKMVFLWSCWWFQNIKWVLEKSPNSQIISTKGTWTMLVNEPLFREINESILRWEDVNWEKIWLKMEKKLANNKNFVDYIRPDKNLWLLFFKKLEELKKEWK